MSAPRCLQRQISHVATTCILLAMFAFARSTPAFLRSGRTSARLCRQGIALSTVGSSNCGGQGSKLGTAAVAASGLGLSAVTLYSSSGSGADCDAPVRKAPRIVKGSDPGTRQLYPPIDTLRTGRLKVSKIHEIYWEESGNPNGKPVVFLHGGPGGGTTPEFRRYFNPSVYRIIIFDQRGCGKSTPHAVLEENTTWDLVADIEKLRKHLGIEKWLVFGGSWGSTLALTYTEEHPDRVTELVLRGIFTLRRKELEFYYQEGSSWLYPDIFEGYREHIPPEERHDMMAAYHKRLTHEDENVRMAAARQWTLWELATSRLLPDLGAISRAEDDRFALAFARIENHYFVNKGWFPCDDYVIKNVHKIKHIPAVIVQGRFDVVCPPQTAWDLHKAWPESELVIVQDAGHAASEPGIRSELIRALDRFGNVSQSQ